MGRWLFGGKPRRRGELAGLSLGQGERELGGLTGGFSQSIVFIHSRGHVTGSPNGSLLDHPYKNVSARVPMSANWTRIASSGATAWIEAQK